MHKYSDLLTERERESERNRAEKQRSPRPKSKYHMTENPASWNSSELYRTLLYPRMRHYRDYYSAQREICWRARMARVITPLLPLSSVFLFRSAASMRVDILITFVTISRVCWFEDYRIFGAWFSLWWAANRDCCCRGYLMNRTAGDKCVDECPMPTK